MKKTNRTVELRTFLKKNKTPELALEIEALLETITPKKGHALDQLMTFAEGIFKEQPEKSSIAVDLVDLFRQDDRLVRSESCIEMISCARKDLQKSLEFYTKGCESNDISRFLKFEKAACIAIDKQISSERKSLVQVLLKDPISADRRTQELNSLGNKLIERKDNYSIAAKSHKRWLKKTIESNEASLVS